VVALPFSLLRLPYAYRRAVSENKFSQRFGQYE
jgi:hypothetical protein